MNEDAQGKSVSYLLSNCRNLDVMSILAYGSYARRDYRPDSDINLLVVLDSTSYSSRDLKCLIEIHRFCRKEFSVSLQMDVWLDSEIELWNKGILLEGHSFIDLSFYNKEGKVLLGTDVRKKFKLPEDIKVKAKTLLGIIESEFKRWFFEQESEGDVPNWMTGWLLVTFLNTLGIVDVVSFKDTCTLIKRTALADTPEFQKYQMKQELEPDEFIRLFRTVVSEAKIRRDANT